MSVSQRTAAALREGIPWHDLVQVTETVEQTAYEALFVPEIMGREAFSTLAGLAGVTSTLRLGTGCVPMTARRPMTTAMAAATVHELSGGRLILTIGAGFERSIAAVRAYVAEVRASQLSFDPRGTPPIWLAALGDKMFALAGEVADGVLLNWCTPDRVLEARAIVGDAARKAGRDPSDVTIAVYVRACIEPDEELALEALRPATGQYASIPHYQRQLVRLGLGAEAEAAAKAFEAGRPRDVPEELVRALGLVGDPDAARARLGAYRDAGADLPVVYPVPVLEPASSLLGTLLALAPSPALEA